MVTDIFAMSTKFLDQIGRPGAFRHITCRAVCMTDTFFEQPDKLQYTNLPLTGGCVFGSGLETLLKEKKEKTSLRFNSRHKKKNPEISRTSDKIRQRGQHSVIHNHMINLPHQIQVDGIIFVSPRSTDQRSKGAKGECGYKQQMADRGKAVERYMSKMTL